MTYLFFLFVFFIQISYWSMFNKKLQLLLILELVLLLGVFMYLVVSYNLKSFFLIFALLSLMMVLDSVLGLCLLISLSRNSSLYSASFYSI